LLDALELVDVDAVFCVPLVDDVATQFRLDGSIATELAEDAAKVNKIFETAIPDEAG
jgi:hypothetical protein